MAGRAGRFVDESAGGVKDAISERSVATSEVRRIP